MNKVISTRMTNEPEVSSAMVSSFHRGVSSLFLLFLVSTVFMACGNEAPKKSAAAAVGIDTAHKAARQPQIATEEKKEDAAATPPVEKILFVLVDALRADKLGCYGFGEPTSPAIDKLAEESVLFEHVHAASPWTAPSFGTLFTGVSPTVHGAGKMLGRNGNGGKEVHGVNVGALRRDLPTLAELMPKNMKKAALINNSFVCKELGYARGFDEFDFRLARLTSYRTADEVTDTAISWLKQNGDEPFFYFVHYFDPHIQYAPPQKYLPEFAPNKPRRIGYPFVDHAAARDGRLNPNEAEKAFIRGLYHGEIRFVDDEFSRLLGYMKTTGLMDDTWIVFISDHGEELFEHGSFDHGHRYEEEVTRIPWLIRAPGGKWHAGKRVPHNVSHVDVFATLLELAHISVPSHAEGASVIPLIERKERANRVSFMEFNLFGGQQCALFDGQFKLIYDIRRDRSFMYDLKIDPMEQKKLTDTNETFNNLYHQLNGKRDALQRAAAGKLQNNAVLSDEARDALKSLGYIE